MLFSHSVFGRLSDDAVAHSRSETARKLTADLRDHARTAGWPGSLVGSLSVRYGDDSFDIQVDGPQQEAVNALEYGSESQTPQGVLRQFTATIHERGSEIAAQALLDYVEGVAS